MFSSHSHRIRNIYVYIGEKRIQLVHQFDGNVNVVDCRTLETTFTFSCRLSLFNVFIR